MLNWTWTHSACIECGGCLCVFSCKCVCCFTVDLTGVVNFRTDSYYASFRWKMFKGTETKHSTPVWSQIIRQTNKSRWLWVARAYFNRKAIETLFIAINPKPLEKCSGEWTTFDSWWLNMRRICCIESNIQYQVSFRYLTSQYGCYDVVHVSHTEQANIDSMAPHAHCGTHFMELENISL